MKYKHLINFIESYMDIKLYTYQKILLYLLNKFSMPFALDNDDRIRIKVSKLEKYIEKQNKTLHLSHPHSSNDNNII